PVPQTPITHASRVTGRHERPADTNNPRRLDPTRVHAHSEMTAQTAAPSRSIVGASASRRRLGFSFFSALLALATVSACSDESPLPPEAAEDTTAEAPLGNPLPVTNFSVVSTTSNSVTLRFTQPHDGLGRTAELDIRFMATPI